MKLHFFMIPAVEPAEAAEELNRFCAAHRVVDVERHFVAAGSNSFWSICVCTQEGRILQKNNKSRVDYREVLNEDDFALFVKLRTLRKEQAEKEGVPPYALFTNEQLAEMVKRKVTSITTLAEIKGIGEARLEKYGRLFLDALTRETAVGKLVESERETGPS